MDFDKIADRQTAQYEEILKNIGGREACEAAAKELKLVMMAALVPLEDGPPKTKDENGKLIVENNPLVWCLAVGQLAKMLIDNAPKPLTGEALALFFNGFGGKIVEEGDGFEGAIEPPTSH